MKYVLVVLFFGVMVSDCAAEERGDGSPNILWICVDDMNDWMGCYGHTAVKTPAIDALATGGVLFERAFVPAPVCSTTRSALMTGCLQTTFGLHHHRSGRGAVKIHLPKGVKPLPQIMKENGFLTFNTRKDDYNFAHDRADLYDSKFHKLTSKSSGAKKGGGKKSGAKKEVPYEWIQHLKGKRFFGQIQLLGGKIGGEVGGRYPAKSRVDAKTMKVAPYYPNHPVFRNAMARHYEQVAVTDLHVGQIVAQLKKHGLYKNTVIIFFTDHGYQLPRGKQFLYEVGIKVPLIIHWPNGTKFLTARGRRRKDLVSCIDLAAVTLTLGGLKIPKWMESQNILANDYTPKKYVIAARDRCDYSIDKIRAVRTMSFKYIRNGKTDRSVMQPQYRDRYATMKTLRALHAGGKLDPVQQQLFNKKRPLEELYDLANDPHEIKNLATDTAYAKVLKQHRAYLAEWIKKTGDKGQLPESAASLREVYRQWKTRCVNPEFDALKKSPR